MAFRFDLGDILDRTASLADEVRQNASEVIDSVGKGAVDIAGGATDTIASTAASASEALGSAMCAAAENASNAGEQIALSDAGKTIADAANAVGGIAIGAAMGVAQGASALASGAATAVEDGINIVKENSFFRHASERPASRASGTESNKAPTLQERRGTTSSTPMCRRCAS